MSVEKCKSTLRDKTYQGITEKINIYYFQESILSRNVRGHRIA